MSLIEDGQRYPISRAERIILGSHFQCSYLAEIDNDRPVPLIRRIGSFGFPMLPETGFRNPCRQSSPTIIEFISA